MCKYLYCYKMTHDDGFAPNPYHGVLTLATCKPTIRRCAEKDYWISGWTSNEVQGKTDKFYFTDENQMLIYLARVTNIITIEEYWERYKCKRPQKILNGKAATTNSCSGKKDKCGYDMGDNIYKPIKGKENEFEQLPNGGGHGKNDQEHDLSGKNVLICEEFYYFGVEQALEIKNKGFVVPRCKKIPSDAEEAKNVIDYVKNNCSKALYYKEK